MRLRLLFSKSYSIQNQLTERPLIWDQIFFVGSPRCKTFFRPKIVVFKSFLNIFLRFLGGLSVGTKAEKLSLFGFSTCKLMLSSS
jgi:hypothetical protein